MKIRWDQKGFTLVEVTVAMAFGLIILAIMVSSFIVQKKYFGKQSAIVEVRENVRSAIQLLVQELMMAGYIAEDVTGGTAPTADVSGESFADGTAEVIEEAAATQITFETDVDGDNISDTVRYTWSGTPGAPLNREVWPWDSGSGTWGASSGAQAVAEDIQQLAFSYFDDGNLIMAGPITTGTQRAGVRRITIDLTARSRKGDQQQMLTTDVSPRNLALN
jgi:prepilin-type N-terminal cleavage/methylation domain-containing protein